MNFDQVADIYDDYVNVDFDIPFFLKQTEHCHQPILELMCGTGRVSIPLLKQGRRLVCVDYSQGMLNRFAEKIKNEEFDVELVNADVSNLLLNKEFDMILLPFHSLQEIISKEMQLQALTAIHRHLSDNGTFICTLQNPKLRLANADGAIRTMGKYKVNDAKNLVISFSNLYQNGIVTGFQFFELYDMQNRLIEKRVLEICFRPIPFDEFNEMLNKTGFKLQKVYGGYDDSTFDIDKSPFMIFKLSK